MPTESAPGRFAVLRRNLVTLPISGHGPSSQSSQSKAQQPITSLTLAILRRFSLAGRFGIGFAKIYWMKESKGPSEGGIIDFYGSCCTDPPGEDRVHQQRL
jgi:hypothetical protein